MLWLWLVVVTFTLVSVHSMLWLRLFVGTFTLVSFHSLLCFWLFVVTFTLVSCPFSALALSFVVTFVLMSYPFSSLSLTICCHLYIGVLSIPCSFFDNLFTPSNWCLVHSLLCLWLFVVIFTLVYSSYSVLALTVCCHLHIGVLTIICSNFDYLLSPIYWCLVHSLLFWLFVVIFILVFYPFSALALTICWQLCIDGLSILCSGCDYLFTPLDWCLVHSLFWLCLLLSPLHWCSIHSLFMLCLLLSPLHWCLVHFLLWLKQFVVTFTLVPCPYSVHA